MKEPHMSEIQTTAQASDTPSMPRSETTRTKITVVGAGFVGLVAASGFAEFGHEVSCVEIDQVRYELLKKGQIPFFERGLDELVARNIKAGRLSFTHDLKSAISGQDIIVIAVGTPSGKSGRSNVSTIEEAIETIIGDLEEHQIIVLKSTVPVGTGKRLLAHIHSKTGIKSIALVNNPEFLREGTAISDFFVPQRIVIGSENPDALERVAHIYRKGMKNSVPIVFTNSSTAEMIKYASNAFIALKVGYANELAGICDDLGVNVLEVVRAMGMDQRIGNEYLVPGPGWGGSCLGKDLREFTGLAADFGSPSEISLAVIRANARHHALIVSKVENLVGSLEGARIGVLGLSFKAGTSDVRESPSLAVINLMLEAGAEVVAFDPRANGEARLQIPALKLVDTAERVAKDIDCLMILTEWEQFQTLDYRTMAETMRQPNMVDARNLLIPESMKRLGFRYLGIGQA